ncbi:hypothetical protein ACIPL1_27825 [Pseudomonas sp. NPDC090202]|uniref:hypothetical protein n=1 Tax=Pseudomonas sp. NPDC090202 TaxID=3364476 RepID=UPI0037F3E3DB
MAKKLTAKQLYGRYEALSEAAEHLQMEWTDSATESAEGLVMSDWLRGEARKWLARAVEAEQEQANRQLAQNRKLARRPPAPLNRERNPTC